MFFGVKGRRGLSLREFKRGAGGAGIEQREMLEGMGGEEPESAHQQNDKDDTAQSHDFFDLKNLPDTDTAAKDSGSNGKRAAAVLF